MAQQVRSLVAAMRQNKPGWHGKVCVEASVADGTIEISKGIVTEIIETVKIRNGR